MLKLVKSELCAMTDQRLVRMRNDAAALGKLPMSEIRAAYDTLEAIRDTISKLLDKVDGK